MSHEQSQEHYHVSARDVRVIENFSPKDLDLLPRMGSMMDVNDMRRIRAVQDSLQAPVTQSSISTPIQFLQKFAPGHVRVLTAAQKADEITGFSTIGRWEDEEIIQGLLELEGVVQPYGDFTNTPLASWNIVYNKRTVVRFELGMEVNILEMRRAAAQNIDSGAEKRNSATLQLDIARNNVAFNGYNNGANQTYGILTDPGLPSYLTAANGASGSPLWSRKTYNEIIDDIIRLMSTIQQNSQDQIDPEKTPITMAVSTVDRQFLNQVPQFGNSVMTYLRETYPNLRVVSAPQLTAANGGANVIYMFAEIVEDGSSDDRRTWMQAIPTKFMVLGVQQETKGYKEDYSNATAGQMLKRPWALARMSGT